MLLLSIGHLTESGEKGRSDSGSVISHPPLLVTNWWVGAGRAAMGLEEESPH